MLERIRSNRANAVCPVLRVNKAIPAQLVVQAKLVLLAQLVSSVLKADVVSPATRVTKA